MSNVYGVKNNLSGWAYVGWLMRNEGWWLTIIKLGEGIWVRGIILINKILGQRRPDTFNFHGLLMKYWGGAYNLAWINERSVEISLAKYVLSKKRGARVLEVGAVLGHYMEITWDVVDKFEPGSEIINEDIVDFVPEKKYDVVLCISTLEHVGWDDDRKDGRKIIGAIENIRQRCMKRGGLFLSTSPVGYNSELDRMLFSGELGFDKVWFLKRTSVFNEWREVGVDDVKGTRYGFPYNNGNAIMIGVVGSLPD